VIPEILKRQKKQLTVKCQQVECRQLNRQPGALVFGQTP